MLPSLQMCDSGAHRRAGAYRALELPRFYRLIQSLAGAGRLRRRLVDRVLDLRSGMRVLDVGCGTADLLANLPPGVVYSGFDINDEYIRSARDRFGTRGRFMVGSAPEIPAELADQAYDRVLVIALLHHLSDEAATRLLVALLGVLAPGGFLVTVDPTLTDGQSWVARGIIGLDRGRMVRRPDGYRALLSGAFQVVSGEVFHDLLRIPYSHFVGRAEVPGDSIADEKVSIDQQGGGGWQGGEGGANPRPGRSG